MAGEEGGSQAGSPEFAAWTSQIAKDVIGPEFAGHKTLTDFAKVHKEAVKQRDALQAEIATLKALDSQGFRIPDEKNAEAQKAFRKALGVPEAEDGYEIVAPKDVPFSDEQMAGFKKLALAQGLTSKQAQALAEYQADRLRAGLETVKAQREEKAAQAMQALREKYGARAQERLDAAAALVNKLGGEDLARELTETGIGNHPKLILMMADLAIKLGEDNFSASGGAGGGSAEVDFDEVYPSMKHLPSRRA